MNLIKINCAFCGKVFFRTRGRYNEAKKFGWKHYCSWGCLYGDRLKRGRVFCENCGKNFERVWSAVSPHNYCSKSCSAIANNKKRIRFEWGKAETTAESRTISEKSIFNKCKVCGKWFRKSPGNLEYCSPECRRKIRRKYTNDQLIEMIKLASRKIKRIPTKREMNEISHICAHFFGSWNNAIIAAGLKPNRSHNQQMYKCAYAKASDGHMCDSISELIIDNWLTKNKITHTKNVPYPETNHRADWGIALEGHNILVEYFGLAKDSPRYDKSIKEKTEICRKNGIPLIEIYPQNLYSKGGLITEEKLKEKFKSITCQGGEICTLAFRFPKPAS